MDQSTNTVVMIRPFIFARNEQTMVNNYFQQIDTLGFGNNSDAALREFDDFAAMLTKAGVRVILWRDEAEPYTPDAIFPNNWMSTHENGTIILYPMFAPNRRLERLADVAFRLESEGFSSTTCVYLSSHERVGHYLEGTGSLVLDRVNRIAYAAISDRTHSSVLKEWSIKSGYEVIEFDAFQSVNGERKPIYHTNVMMSICSDFAVVCLECIDNVQQRDRVRASLLQFRPLVEISENQVAEFAGNMLELKGIDGKKFLVMSERAYDCLLPAQIEVMKSFCEIGFSSLKTIENLGGGSARCMIAEVFLKSK